MCVKRNRYVRIILRVILVVLVLAGGLLGYLKSQTYNSMPEVAASMAAGNVRIEGRIVVFDPPGEPWASLVFYQGGLVETEAYAVLAQLLAAEGIRVFLPRMPLNLSILNGKVFDRIHKAYDHGEKWYIGGHSLGGATAAIYVARYHEQVSGLILLAAYPAESSDLSDLAIPVLSITASDDGVMNRERFTSTKRLLPADTVFVEIEGGNHANFGYYGSQKGDGPGAISRQVQHLLTANLILDLIGEEGP